MQDERTPNHRLTLSELWDELPLLIMWTRLEDDEFVIVEVGDYYVQFTAHLWSLYAEAVSNHYLAEFPEETELLTERDYLALALVGWNEPGTEDEDGDRHDNFWQEWPMDLSSDEIAGELLRALVAVYMRGEGGTFDVFVGNFEHPSRYDEVLG
jgi:hypothetical protein